MNDTVNVFFCAEQYGLWMTLKKKNKSMNLSLKVNWERELQKVKPVALFEEGIKGLGFNLAFLLTLAKQNECPL